LLSVFDSSSSAFVVSIKALVVAISSTDSDVSLFTANSASLLLALFSISWLVSKA